MLKHLPLSQQKLVSGLNICLSRLHEQNLLSPEISKKRLTQEAKVAEAQLSDNLIYSQIILQKRKFQRQFTIDLLNVYEISSIVLTFEKSDKKVPLHI